MRSCATQTAPVDLFVLIAYPAVFQLHAAGWGQSKGAAGSVVLPPTVPASTAYLEPSGAYLVDAGHVCVLWVGSSASSTLVAVRSPAVGLGCRLLAFSLLKAPASPRSERALLSLGLGVSRWSLGLRIERSIPKPPGASYACRTYLGSPQRTQATGTACASCPSTPATLLAPSSATQHERCCASAAAAEPCGQRATRLYRARTPPAIFRRYSLRTECHRAGRRITNFSRPCRGACRYVDVTGGGTWLN